MVSGSVWPHRRQPTRLPRPWDSPGKNTGVGCHFLLQCMNVKSESEVAQLCPTLRNPMDCSPPGSSVHGIFQARVLEWGAIAFSIFIYTWNQKINEQIKQKYNCRYRKQTWELGRVMVLRSTQSLDFLSLPVTVHIAQKSHVGSLWSRLNHNIHCLVYIALKHLKF